MFGSSCELQWWQPPKARDNSGEKDQQDPVHSHVGCRPPWQQVRDGGSFWPPISHSPWSVNTTTQPALSSAWVESRFQPHICVLLQVWVAACCFGNLRAREPAAFGDWSARLIHTVRQLDWSKLDHVWKRESYRESALLSSRWYVSGKQDGQRALMHPLCHKNKNWRWRIFIQTWEKAEQRGEGTSRRGGGGAENRQGNSSFWERVERILCWGKLLPVIFVQILKFTEPSSGSCMLCFWLAISTYHMEKPQFELYNIVWIWYWRIFITEPALNCMFFSFDVWWMKQTHKTKTQKLKTTKEMHREIPVFWIGPETHWL